MFIDLEATEYINMNKSFILVAVIMMVFASSTVPCMCYRWIRSSQQVMDDDDISYYMKQVSTNLLNIFLRNERDNFVNSPIGVVQLLAFALLGATGKSQKELMRALQVHCNSQSKLYNIIGNYLKQYKNSNLDINIATTIIVESSLETLLPLSIEDMKNLNISSIIVTNKDINRIPGRVDLWLRRVTNDRYRAFFMNEDLFLASKLKMALLNFASFNGIWSMPFNLENTKYRQFITADGEILKTPIMYQNIKTRYSEFSDFNIQAKFVQLPYKVNNVNEKQVSMFVIVPYGEGTLIDIERNIRRITLRRLYQSSLVNVDIYIPKFKFEVTNNLNDYIKEMGVEDAFTDNAHLSTLENIASDEKLSISTIFQKTCIEVYENGSQPSRNKDYVFEHNFELKIGSKDFIADRPFIVIIANEDFIFFTARITNTEFLL